VLVEIGLTIAPVTGRQSARLGKTEILKSIGGIGD
jgi:hypothetical protein